MKDRENEVKLYNVLFPFWMIMLFPQLWAIVLPGNFIIDLLCSMDLRSEYIIVWTGCAFV